MDVEDEQPVNVPFYLSMKQKAVAILLAYFSATGVIAGVSILRYGRIPAVSAALEEPYLVLWNSTFDGVGIANAVIRTEDGYVVVGDKDQGIFLLKVDRNGQLIWCGDYGVGGEEWDALDLIQASDGGYVLVGCAAPEGYMGGKGVCMLVLKVGPDGTLQWNRTYSEVFWQLAASIADASHGEYLVLGTIKREEEGFNYDICLMKIDSAGKMIWNRTYGGDRYDWATKIKKCMMGGYIITGMTTSFHTEQQDPRFTNSYVIRIRDDGEMMWQRTYGGLFASSAWDVVETEPEVFVLAGGYGKDIEYNSGDIYVFKIGEEGGLIWERTYGDNESPDSATALATSPRGVIIVGRGNPQTPGNTFVLYVAELDYATGLLIWEQRYPGLYSPDVVEAEKDGVLVAASVPDLWLVRLYHGEMPIPAIYPLLILAFLPIILLARAIIRGRGSEN